MDQRLDELCVLMNQLRLAAARQAGQEHENVGNRMFAGLIYNERFNLRAAALRIVRHAHAAGGVLDATPDIAWSNYVRFLFEPNRFYQFASISQDKFVYIARNRSAPGRQHLAEGEATGRLITHAWFELAVDEYDDRGLVVAPMTAGHSKSLELRNATISEIMMAAGLHIEREGTARETEVRYEQAFADLEVLRFVGDRFDHRRAEWYFVLHEPVEIEEHAYMSRPVADLTKMSLVRRLQIIDGTCNATRAERWRLTKEAIVQLLVDHADLAVEALGEVGGDDGSDDEPPAPPRGRGRGRGAAKAKAKARGGGRAGAEGGRGRGGGGRRGRGRGGGRG